MDDPTGYGHARTMPLAFGLSNNGSLKGRRPRHRGLALSVRPGPALRPLWLHAVRPLFPEEGVAELVRIAPKLTRSAEGKHTPS
jgi:hypothetical protein